MIDPCPCSVRPYRRGDERALVELFRQVFGHPITEEHWRWKLQWPATPDNAWLALSDDRPVFHYGGIPTRFWLEQAPASTMVAVDAMTAPAFRRQGLLTRVVGQAHAAWRQNGVAFVLGLPNEQWGSRARALGWQPLFSLQWLVRPLRPEALLARRLHVPMLERATLPAVLWQRFLQWRLRRDPQTLTEPVAQADESFDRLWERCRADWKFSTVRDRAWVQWRFLAPPERHYELTLARRAGEPVGYTAHRLIGTPGRRSAELAELFTAEADQATCHALLFDLISRLETTDAQAVVTLAVRGTRLFRWLRGAGFLAGGGFSVHMVPLREDFPLQTMLQPQNWNLSGADFDVI